MGILDKRGVHSAKNEWGQWASFSLGLGKLKSYSSKGVSLGTPYIADSKEEFDWFKTASAVLSGSKAVYEKYEENTEKDVDKYLKSHSKEEYKQQILSRSLPFQNDPVAMKIFKTKYGSIYAGMAFNEFQEKVTNGDFTGKSEAEIDAEYFKFMRDKARQIDEETSGEFAGKVFSEAFYGDSPKYRLTVMKTQQKREQEIAVTKDIMANKALIQTGIDSGEINSPETLFKAFQAVQDSTGYHYTPKQLKEFQDDTLNMLTQSPYGVSILKALKGKEYFGLGGLKYDDAVIEAKIGVANKLSADRNAQDWYAFNQSLDDLVIKGDASSLEGMLKVELKRSNNTVTPYSEAINDALSRCKKALAKQAQGDNALAKKEAKFASKIPLMSNYLRGASQGKEVPPSNSELQNGFTQADLSEYVSQLYLNNKISDDDLINITNNPSLSIKGASNPCTVVLENLCKFALRNDVGQYIKGYAKELPSEDKLEEGFGRLISLTTKDPNILNKVLKYSDNRDVGVMASLMMSYRSGIPLFTAINQIRAVNQIKDPQRVTTNQRDYFRRLNDLVATDVANPNDSYSLSLLNDTGATAIAYGGCSAKEALDVAKQNLLISHVRVGTSYIPKSYFFGITNNSNLINVLAEELQENYRSLPDSGQIMYNPYKNDVVVLSKDASRIIKHYTQEDLEGFLSEYNKDIIEKNQRSNLMGSIFNGSKGGSD